MNIKHYLIIILLFILPLVLFIICKAEDPNLTNVIQPYQTPSNTISELQIPESYMFITEWGSDGDGNGDFKEPSGIAVSPEGYVYVADSGNNRIQKFDSNGKFIIKWGSRGEGKGKFNKNQSLNPLRIALDNNGNVYVTDSENRTIQKFDFNGNFLKAIYRVHTENIAIDSKGNIYLIESFPYYLVITDSENKVLDIKRLDTGNFDIYEGIKGESSFANLYSRIELGGSLQSHSIKVDSSGNIYLVIGAMRFCPACHKKLDNLFNGWIMKLDKNFNIITEWGNEGKKDETFKKEKENLGNNIFATIALDSEGNVYVAECANNRIEKFDPNGIFLARWGKEGSDEGEFKTPFGIDVDQEGNVYVLDYGNCRIQKFAPNPEYKSNN
jgi:DNA-binding beta-propeller fold protein YncE